MANMLPELNLVKELDSVICQEITVTSNSTNARNQYIQEMEPRIVSNLVLRKSINM